MAATQLAIRVFADDLVEEEILGDDDVAFATQHLGDVRDTTGAVSEARRLDDDVDRGHDHLADRLGRQREAAHGDHGFETAQRLAR